MSTEKILNLTGSLSNSGSTAITATYQIPVTINNNTAVDFDRAEVAIKDEGKQYVGTAKFQKIAARKSATQNVSMPGGVESCAYNIWPEVGEKIFGLGYGDNASAVVITIGE